MWIEWISGSSKKWGLVVHIGFVPFYTDSWSDVVWIENGIKLVLKRIRQNAPKIAERRRECGYCNNFGQVEYHHIRPLWSVAAEFILRRHPLHYSDLSAVYKTLFDGVLDAETKSAHDDLIPLCKWCHGQATVQSNQNWKDNLSKNFPLLWSYRSESDVLRSLAWDWYWEPHLCP